ncbi:hypothetical protein Poli38472_011007 [Pythium oligandrum]|uniref:Ubiquitin carboxyl-terminal hydrolase n=1 Tax=Pythium oligandrum TaxID=41045 RepID=A0A8K1CPI0_PYTOL|nr:hypothetical protein Poli38472_011007 [Pythium oligandrum]|eukprot:TMW67387.1 hypothetical protein Poli38472_011007 [Pythium oligandrum]
MGKGKKKQKAHKKQHKNPAASESNGAPANAAPTTPSVNAVGVEPRSNKLLDRTKQRAIIQRLMKQADEQGLQVGDKRFVIAAKWWERWCQYVGYDSDDSSSPAGTGLLTNASPSKINNLPLLQLPADKLDELMGAPLRPQLKESYHFALIPQEVWDALLCWYGGGPAIARFVVEVGDRSLGNTFKRVELYPELVEQEDDPMNGIDTAAASSTTANGPATEITKPPPRKLPVPSSIQKMCGACRTTTGSLKRCGNCQLIWYCGSACQTAHWKFHKSACRAAVSNEDKESAIQGSLEEERRGKMGLRNLGNTCFMNSALQCLSHVEVITKYFLSNKYIRDLNKDNPLGTGGSLALEFDALLKELWFGTSPSISPAGLKRAIGRFAPQFSGFQQHDSQELLAYLLDGLHEDLNRVKQKPYTEVKESDGKQDDAEVAQEAWKRHLLRNDSIFVDHVQGQFKSTVVCPICSKVSITFDPFNCVQLELPIQQNRRMEAIVVAKGKQMMRYWVEVPKKGNILSLKRAVSKLSGIPAHLMIATDIYQSTVYRVISDTERLAMLRDEDRILLYHVEPPTPPPSSDGSEPQPLYYGFLYHRLDTALKGDPLLFTFTAETTCEEMLETWSEMIAAHVAQTKGLTSKLSASLLATCTYLSNRDGAFMRSEAVPASKTSRFLDYATLNPDEGLEDLVYMSISWSPALLNSPGGPRPDVEHVADHESMREHAAHKGTRDGISLYDCFRNFTKPETLDQANLWYCSKCKEHRQARKTMEIWKLPDVLIVSLKRFEYRNEILRDKLDAFVDFPLEDLDMTSFCLEKTEDPERLRYDLFAVSNHYGSMGFGHYTAFARSWQNSDKYPGWYSFDDSQVSPAMPGQVKSNAAYILFYKRRQLTASS